MRNKDDLRLTATVICGYESVFNNINFLSLLKLTTIATTTYSKLTAIFTEPLFSRKDSVESTIYQGS